MCEVWTLYVLIAIYPKQRIYIHVFSSLNQSHSLGFVCLFVMQYQRLNLGPHTGQANALPLNYSPGSLFNISFPDSLIKW